MPKYSIVLQWSEEDDGYIATIPELPGLSAFGSTEQDALKELSIAKDAYLEVLKEDSEEIPEPDLLKSFSGQTRLRLPKSLHQSLAHQAKLEGVSLNTYIVNLLSQGNLLSIIERRIQTLQNTVSTSILTASTTNIGTKVEVGTDVSLQPSNDFLWLKGNDYEFSQ